MQLLPDTDCTQLSTQTTSLQSEIFTLKRALSNMEDERDNSRRQCRELEASKSEAETQLDAVCADAALQRNKIRGIEKNRDDFEASAVERKLRVEALERELEECRRGAEDGRHQLVLTEERASSTQRALEHEREEHARTKDEMSRQIVREILERNVESIKEEPKVRVQFSEKGSSFVSLVSSA